MSKVGVGGDGWDSRHPAVPAWVTSAQTPGTDEGVWGPPVGDPVGLPAPSPWGGVLLASMIVTLLAAAASMLVSVPFVLIEPGPVRNTLGSTQGHGPLITVRERQTYPTSGELDLTTVSVSGGPSSSITLVGAVVGWLSSSRAIYPEDAVYPKGQTAEQAKEESQAQMADSQSQAKAAALRELGIPVTPALALSSVLPGSPGEGKLKDGDVLVAIDGAKVVDGEQVRDAVRRHRPDDASDPVVLRVRRAGEERDVSIVPVKGSDGAPVIKVLLGQQFEFPFPVEIKIDDIGGPSAGTMFALGIIDKLTPGAMTGGKTIAGTGTIDADGRVGEIGGIRQKVIGAHDHGARWFLAPAGNCSELTGHVPDGLTVYRIETLHQARQVVESLGRSEDVTTVPRCG